ncbi:MAG: hypothetical protein M3Y91_12745 [Actinomycetota bacterium]|nr:hypothetical protein [Actinomycetota bacterium]
MPTTQKTKVPSTDYEVPLVHVRVPQRVGNTTFWLGLTGAVIAGAVELPLAAAVAAGVVVARHRARAARSGGRDAPDEPRAARG